MEFKNINSYTSAYKYAEKRGGVPKVPFAIFWEFFPEDEKRLVDVALQVQHTFNLVQSTEPFKIEEVKKIEEDLFEIEINPGGLIPFKIDQDSFEQQQTAQQIDKQLDAHQKKKEQKAPEKKEQKTPSQEEQKAPEKKVRKTSEGLYEEFKRREEKILDEIRAEALAKAKAEAEAAKVEAEAAKAEVEAMKAEAEAMKVKATKAKAEAKVGADIEALINALAEAKADAKIAEAKAEAKIAEAKAEAKASETKTKVEAKATTLKLFGYSVFEFSK